MHIYTSVSKEEFREVCSRFIRKSVMMINKNLIPEKTIMAKIKSDQNPTYFILKMVKKSPPNTGLKCAQKSDQNPTLLVCKIVRRSPVKTGLRCAQKSDQNPTYYHYQFEIDRGRLIRLKPDFLQLPFDRDIIRIA